MNFMKKSLIALMILSNASIIPHYGRGYHGGGGWGYGGAALGGLAAGTAIGIAASSGNRYQSPETASVRQINKDLERLRKDYNKGRIDKKEYEERRADLERQRQRITA